MTLPTGTVTFLFTDIEGSTKLAQAYPDKWEALQQRHHAILQSAIEAQNGYVFQIIGDAFCAAFHTAPDALTAAISIQRNLQNENWDPAPVKVRIGINTGSAQVGSVGDVSGGYTGYATLVKVQRMMSAGSGGQVLLTQATYELVRDKLSDNVSLLDLGEHRLKDLIRPEHVYQLNAPGLTNDFPPIKTLDRYRHNLPVQTTTFIGREKEMAEIKQALANHRLVTLTGSGGAGKTRLSLQVAADLLDQFPSGVWFVELAPITDPDLIPQTILTAVDMQTQQGKSVLESLTDFLREKTSLLVLDNCEHLIDACAKITDTLLKAAPNLIILASSREALGIKGEQSWRVPSMSAPDVKHLPPIDQLSQYEAVRLFIDRALLAQPHFAITNENAPAVAQICQRLDGIPLAIELATARLRMLSAEQICTRLDDRFRLLTGGSRTALPRQQTLRALIDWSYALLSENECVLLRRLAVFAGGWWLEAAEQVCSDPGQAGISAGEVLGLLGHLVDKSLVLVDEQTAQARFYLLETVRQYAAEKLLESGEGEKIRNQHLAYYLQFAETAEPYLKRSEQVEWLNQLELDHDNLRIALEWAVKSEQVDSPEAGLRLGNALCRFWYLRAHRSEGFDWLRRALAKSGQPMPTVARARALGNAEFLAGFSIEMEQSAKLLDESMALCQELNDKSGFAFAILWKGGLAIDSRDYETARSLFETSLNLYRQLDDKWMISFVISSLGAVAYHQDDYSTARRHYEESLQLALETGDKHLISGESRALGATIAAQGNYSESQIFYEKSLALEYELNTKAGILASLHSLGGAALAQGNYQQAEKLFEKCLVIAQDVNEEDKIARTKYSLGQAAYFLKDYLRATKLYSDALAYNRGLGRNRGTGWITLCLGKIARQQGNHAEAYSLCREAMNIFRKRIDDKPGIAYTLMEFGALGLTQGQASRAVILFGMAEAIFESTHYNIWPIERAEFDRHIAAARTALGEEAYTAAYKAGKQMTLDKAVAYALKELEQ